MSEQGTDLIVSELLSELKAENNRKDTQIKGLHRVVTAVVISALLSILLVITGFLWYLNQYDFSATETTTNTAEGVYALIDSEGNVISSDITAEDIAAILEGAKLNGEGDLT